MFVHKSEFLRLSSVPTLDIEIHLSRPRMLYKRFRHLKGRDRLDMVVELKVHYYSEQFLNKSVKSFVIFHQIFQSEEETMILQFCNNMDKTLQTDNIIQTS